MKKFWSAKVLNIVKCIATLESCSNPCPEPPNSIQLSFQTFPFPHSPALSWPSQKMCLTPNSPLPHTLHKFQLRRRSVMQPQFHPSIKHSPEASSNLPRVISTLLFLHPLYQNCLIHVQHLHLILLTNNSAHTTSRPPA